MIAYTIFKSSYLHPFQANASFFPTENIRKAFFTPFSGTFVDFEQVNVCWVQTSAVCISKKERYLVTYQTEIVFKTLTRLDC